MIFFLLKLNTNINKNNTNNIIELIQNQATRLLVTADWAKIENINYSMVVRIIRSLRIVHTSRCSPEQYKYILRIVRQYHLLL